MANAATDDVVALASECEGAVHDAPPTPPSRWQQMFGRDRCAKEEISARTCTEKVVAGSRPEELADDPHKVLSGCFTAAAEPTKVRTPTSKVTFHANGSRRAFKDSQQGLEHVAWPDVRDVEGAVDIEQWISDVRRESDRITAAAFNNIPCAHTTFTEGAASPRAMNANAKATAEDNEDHVGSNSKMYVSCGTANGHYTSALDYYSMIRSSAGVGSASTSPETVVASSCSPSSCGTGPSVPSSPNEDGQGSRCIIPRDCPNALVLRTPEQVSAYTRSPSASGMCARTDYLRSVPTANVSVDVEAGGSNEKENESLVEARDFLQAWLRVDDEASIIKKRAAPASQMRHKTHAVAIVRNSTSNKRMIQAHEQKQESKQMEDICNQEARPPKHKIIPEHAVSCLA